MKPHNATVSSYFLPVRMDDPVCSKGFIQRYLLCFVMEAVFKYEQVVNLEKLVMTRGGSDGTHEGSEGPIV